MAAFKYHAYVYFATCHPTKYLKLNYQFTGVEISKEGAPISTKISY